MRKSKILNLLEIILLFAFFLPLACRGANIDFIADMHAGKWKRRIDSRGSIVYPARAIIEFRRRLINDANRKVDALVVLGDNTQDGSKKYARRLRDIAKRYGVKVIWVEGNHDSDDSFSIVSSRKYYFVDIKGTRIIVLDSTEKFPKSTGWIDSEQIQWLKKVITSNSIIAMHHPYIDSNGNYPNIYSEFRQVAKDIPIYAGHLHCSYRENNLTVIPPLTNPVKECGFGGNGVSY